MRVLGIDPGLTRCGIGIVDVAPTRSASLVYVGVIETAPGMALELRLLTVARGIRSILQEFAPQAVAVERVFAQHNLRTVMGTAQVSGVALQLAAEAGLAVGLHTPSEVKAAITGYGAAEKRQVGTMVAKVLGLSEVPKPADAADALALALCHAWSGSGSGAWGSVVLGGPSSATQLTPAQRAWRAAEASASASAGRSAPVSTPRRRA
ncbi:MAG: crossover junction endodeoxyribonuclease RuvC [Salinibacterium sp.]|nr:crossover junction endodeoxyribonuclease RuvC [Salinibacterium sp.]